MFEDVTTKLNLKDKLVISLAAGITVPQLQTWMPHSRTILYFFIVRLAVLMW